MNDQSRFGATEAKGSRELIPDEVRQVSGGIAESLPPVRYTLVRPGDTKGIAL